MASRQLTAIGLFLAGHGKSSQVLNPPSWRNHTGTTIMKVAKTNGYLCYLVYHQIVSWFGMMRFLWDR